MSEPLGLGVLGLGTQPPNPEWGTMLGESRSYIRSHPHLATFTGLFGPAKMDPALVEELQSSVAGILGL